MFIIDYYCKDFTYSVTLCKFTGLAKVKHCGNTSVFTAHDITWSSLMNEIDSYLHILWLSSNQSSHLFSCTLFLEDFSSIFVCICKNSNINNWKPIFKSCCGNFFQILLQNLREIVHIALYMYQHVPNIHIFKFHFEMIYRDRSCSKGETIHHMYRNRNYFGDGSVHDTWRPLTIPPWEVLIQRLRSSYKKGV
jgi:hypothetical protein